MAISKKGWLGVARETTAGTPVATPTLYTPTKSGFENKTDPIYLDEERGSRDGNYARVPGNQYANLTAKGGWYNDSSVYFLMGFMGAPVSTQPNVGTAPTVYLHTFNLADIPPSLTLFRSTDFAVYQFGYAAPSKVALTFSGNNKLLEIDSTLKSNFGIKMGAPPTPSFSTMLPFPGWSANVQFGGVQSLDVMDMTITLDTKQTDWFGADGAQGYNTLYYGERTAKIEMLLRFDNDTFYNKFFNSPQADDHVAVTFNGPTIASTYKQSFTLDFPIVGYDSAAHDFSKDNVMVKVVGTARPGSVANSLFSATVQNTITSYAS